LSTRDPAEALRLKTHAGAPANLAWDGYARTLRSVRAAWRRRRRRAQTALTRLFGAPYPVE